MDRVKLWVAAGEDMPPGMAYYSLERPQYEAVHVDFVRANLVRDLLDRYDVATELDELDDAFDTLRALVSES